MFFTASATVKNFDCMNSNNNYVELRGVFQGIICIGKFDGCRSNREAEPYQSQNRMSLMKNR